MSRTIKRTIKRVLRSMNEKVNPEDYHLPLPEPVPLLRTTAPKQVQKIYAKAGGLIERSGGDGI